MYWVLDAGRQPFCYFPAWTWPIDAVANLLCSWASASFVHDMMCEVAICCTAISILPVALAFPTMNRPALVLDEQIIVFG